MNRDKIYAFGRSLGGAVVMQLALRRGFDLRGVIVENTFTNTRDVALCWFPFLKYYFNLKGRFGGFLVRDKWDSVKIAPKVKRSALFIAAKEDEV